MNATPFSSPVCHWLASLADFSCVISPPRSLVTHYSCPIIYGYHLFALFYCKILPNIVLPFSIPPLSRHLGNSTLGIPPLAAPSFPTFHRLPTPVFPGSHTVLPPPPHYTCHHLPPSGSWTLHAMGDLLFEDSYKQCHVISLLTLAHLVHVCVMMCPPYSVNHCLGHTRENYFGNEVLQSPCVPHQNWSLFQCPQLLLLICKIPSGHQGRERRMSHQLECHHICEVRLSLVSSVCKHWNKTFLNCNECNIQEMGYGVYLQYRWIVQDR